MPDWMEREREENAKRYNRGFNAGYEAGKKAAEKEKEEEEKEDECPGEEWMHDQDISSGLY